MIGEAGDIAQGRRNQGEMHALPDPSPWRQQQTLGG